LRFSRYGVRITGFALLYLLALVAGDATGGVVRPAAAVGAIWLVAQAGQRRRFDVLAMMVLSALAPATGDLLAGLAQAVPQVVPAVLFAWLLERWLPGFWRGHGDRFRRPGTTLARLAGAAVVASVAGAVLQGVALTTDFGVADVGYALARDTVTVLAAVLLTRVLKQRFGKHPAAGQRLGQQPPAGQRWGKQPPAEQPPAERPSAGKVGKKAGKAGKSHLTVVR
jgi:hypothetical protein